jgi:uncharacterized protein YjbI with pentapeptide repeats
MRTESHLEILMQGASTWNAWRAANSSLQPKLRDADLTGADLRGFDLCFIGGFGRGVDLSGARLNKAELTGMDLRCADLSGATLECANLRGANLGGTELAGTKLGHADLSNAQLGDFVGADLRDATLHGARRQASMGATQICRERTSAARCLHMSIFKTHDLTARTSPAPLFQTAEFLG